jgi:hypothetical protein
VETCGEEEAWLSAFLSSALRGGEWSAYSSTALSPGEGFPPPNTLWVGPRAGLDAVDILLLPGIEPRFLGAEHVLEITILTCIGNVLDSNLDRLTRYPDWGYRDFPQSFQANSAVVPRLNHGLFLQNSFKFIIIHLTIRHYIVSIPKASLNNLIRTRWSDKYPNKNLEGYTDRQQGDLISLLLFFHNMEVGWKRLLGRPAHILVTIPTELFGAVRTKIRVTQRRLDINAQRYFYLNNW